MPASKRRLSWYDDNFVYSDPQQQKINENFDNKFSSMQSYLKEKYGKEFPKDSAMEYAEDWAQIPDDDDTLAMMDNKYAKYKKQLTTLSEYSEHAYDQAEKRRKKERQDVAADIIKSNIKEHMNKKKAKVERTKLIKKRNEAATKIQKTFQNSKSQKIKNLPKKAKEEVQKLKAKLKKPETAAEKVKRLNRTTEEIVKNQRVRSGQNYNANL
jgi:hypothetical protein